MTLDSERAIECRTGRESELMSRNRISKFLVVCPKLLMPQWKEELESKSSASPGFAPQVKNFSMLSFPRRRQRRGLTHQSARMYLNALGQAGILRCWFSR